MYLAKEPWNLVKLYINIYTFYGNSKYLFVKQWLSPDLAVPEWWQMLESLSCHPNLFYSLKGTQTVLWMLLYFSFYCPAGCMPYESCLFPEIFNLIHGMFPLTPTWHHLLADDRISFGVHQCGVNKWSQDEQHIILESLFIHLILGANTLGNSLSCSSQWKGIISYLAMDTEGKT